MPQFVMPMLGHLMEEGTVAAWRVQPGDQVRRGDILCEIETDKTTVEVESPFSGKVGQILVPAGGTVEVGAPLATYEAD
ncbi:MAG: biotin/lipoyl-binding protein [Anaerolineaceae bacterium]|nr:biotin/lipoyl-binding protein [Anaerolineaceae bacterium]